VDLALCESWLPAPDAGAEMSGKAQPGEEVIEPKPLQRPGT